MTNYQELKRLAEAATVGPWIAGNDDDSDYYLVGPVAFDRVVTHPVVKLHNERNADYIAAASPDVVLGLIKSLEHTTMAAEAEAKEVDERNAVIAGLRTQNQALMEALERMVESVTGVDQVSAVDEARAALTAAQQAQPPAPSEAAREYMTGYSDAKEWAKPSQALELSDDEIDALLPTITLKGLDPKQQVWLTKKDAIAFARAIIAAINAKEQLNG